MSKKLVYNRKAFHLFDIGENWEAGILLTGTEVKSLRQGYGQIQDAYIDIINSELWLKGANIKPYTYSSHFNHEALRMRKLLLHKIEITKIIKKISRKGLTLIPISIYLNTSGRIKICIALATGKTTYDKRISIKERENKRALSRIRKELS